MVRDPGHPIVGVLSGILDALTMTTLSNTLSAATGALKTSGASAVDQYRHEIPPIGCIRMRKPTTWNVTLAISGSVPV